MGIARKSILGFGGQVYMLVTGLASTVIVARLLGPEGKGVLAVVAAIPSLVLGVASFGLGPALAYMAGKNKYPARELATAAVGLSLALGLGVGLALWLFRGILLESILIGLSPSELAVVILSLPAYYLTSFLGGLFSGHGRAVEVAALSSLGATLSLTAVVVSSIYAPRDSLAVVVGLAIAVWVGAVVSLLTYRSGLSFSIQRVAHVARAIAPYAAKSYLGQATSMFFLRADVFFLNFFAGPSAVGIYSVATSLAEKLWLLSGPVATAVYAQITGAERTDSIRLTTLTARALLVLNGVAGLALFVLSLVFVPVVYGVEFSAAVWYLALLLPGVVVYAVCQPYSQFFVGQLGKPGVTSNLSALMMLLSAVLYVTLIPVYGAAGAALGSTISYSSAMVGYAWLMPRAAAVTLREMLLPTAADFALYRKVGVSAFARVRPSHRRDRY